MIDPFYAFLGFVLIAVLDVLAAQSGLKLYYRVGIPVFTRRLDSAQIVDPHALQDELKSTPLNPSIRVRRLAPDLVGLREVLFEPRAGLRYLPIFHAAIRTTEQGLPVGMTGFLNGYVLAALAYLVYRSIYEPSYVPVAVLILVVLGLSYAGQSSVYNRMAKLLQGENIG